MSAHDRWLARYRHSEEEMFCANRDCPHHEGITVDYEEEYGQGWTTPEECPLCHGELLWETNDEEEDDEAPTEEDAERTGTDPADPDRDR